MTTFGIRSEMCKLHCLSISYPPATASRIFASRILQDWAEWAQGVQRRPFKGSLEECEKLKSRMEHWRQLVVLLLSLVITQNRP